MFQEDRLFERAQIDVAAFEFNEKVAAVFPDMISRSVPGYSSILSGISLITARFAQPYTCLYDLGCSLGASMLAMAKGVKKIEGCQLIGIDNSQAMLTRAQVILDELDVGVPCKLQCGDITRAKIECASVVVLNFTLQFVAPEQRLALLQKIYKGLKPGGILITSEKFNQAEPWSQQLLTDLHLDFKRVNGYNELEISQKRTALESVMQPDTFEQRNKSLYEAGFSRIKLWYQCLNFGSLMALK